jgi:hypothetical protein
MAMASTVLEIVSNANHSVVSAIKKIALSVIGAMASLLTELAAHALQTVIIV